MKHVFSLFLFFVLFAAQSFAYNLYSSSKPENIGKRNSDSSMSHSLDLLSLFKSEDTWKKSPDAFVIAYRKNGFVFSDDGRSSAYSVKRTDLSFGSLPVYEACVYWNEKKLSRVEISVFNKGDAERRLNQREFERLVKRVSDILDANFGNGVSSPQERLANHMLSYSKRWSKAPMLARLQWALTRPHRTSGEYLPFSAEYLKVTFVMGTGFSAGDNARLMGKSILLKPKRPSELRACVVKNPNGDVYISGIPMVDQGQKGYCAAATAERLLRYYGLLVDQHQVAQLAETSAQSGTSLDGITSAVEKIGRSFSLDCDVLLRSNRGDFSRSDFASDLEAYNKIAKKKGAPVIDWRDHAVHVSPNVYSIDLISICFSMDSLIFLEVKSAQKMKIKAFCRNIVKFIDSGVPLMWSCIVGIYPEVPDVGAPGGHMRLITGYNQRTQEIIYSDTWGAGHDFKRMPIDMAWSMSMGLIALKPGN